MCNTIRMYSGITSGRVLNGELLYTKILEVNLFAFAYTPMCMIVQVHVYFLECICTLYCDTPLCTSE